MSDTAPMWPSWKADAPSYSARLLRLADQARLLIDPEPAAGRMCGFLEFEGVA